MSIENFKKPVENVPEKPAKEFHGEQRELSDEELNKVSGGMLEIE